MVDEKIITTKEFATACRKAIPEGIVLLENDGSRKRNEKLTNVFRNEF